MLINVLWAVSEVLNFSLNKYTVICMKIVHSQVHKDCMTEQDYIEIMLNTHSCENQSVGKNLPQIGRFVVGHTLLVQVSILGVPALSVYPVIQV